MMAVITIQCWCRATPMISSRSGKSGAKGKLEELRQLLRVSSASSISNQYSHHSLQNVLLQNHRPPTTQQRRAHPAPRVRRLPIPNPPMRTVMSESTRSGLPTHRHGAILRQREGSRRSTAHERSTPGTDLCNNEDSQPRGLSRSYLR